LNETFEDCLIIDDDVASNSKSNTNVTKKQSQTTKVNNQSARNNQSQLNDYVKMVETQQYNPENEEQNKKERISTLISAMPEQHKQTALEQVSKYEANKNKNKCVNTNERMNAMTSSGDEMFGVENFNENGRLIRNAMSIEEIQVLDNLKRNESQKANMNQASNQFLNQNLEGQKNLNDALFAQPKPFYSFQNEPRERNRNPVQFKSADKYIRNRSKSNNMRKLNNNNGNWQNQIVNTNNSSSSSDLNDKFNNNSNNDLKFIIIDGSNVARE
jgi:hypothetical protein